MMQERYGVLGSFPGSEAAAAVHRDLGNGGYAAYGRGTETLPAFLRSFGPGGLDLDPGLAEQAAALCDDLSYAAMVTGRADTVLCRDGRLMGRFALVSGFDRALLRAGISLEERRVLILGSGTQACAAAYCAEQASASRVDRVPEDGGIPEGCRDAEVLIRTGSSPSPDLSLFPDLCAAADFGWDPVRSRLLMQAEDLGIPCLCGPAILTETAAVSESLFSGTEIPDGRIRKAFEDLMAREQNLVLIGMPGAGKTTTGSLLSRMTGREAIETDDLIEQRVGCTIPAFFAAHGEEAFRRAESEVAAEVGKLRGRIIVTGGGIVTRPENYAPLRQNGFLIEILRPLELLETVGRPLSAGKDTLAVMEARRRPMYDRFRCGAVSNTGTKEETARAAWALFTSGCALWKKP